MKGLYTTTARSGAHRLVLAKTINVWCAMIVALFCAALLAILNTQGVQAAERVYTHDIPPTATDFDQLVSIPKFDSQLGVLEAVEIDFVSRLEGSVQYESLDAGPTFVTATMNGWLRLTGPDGALLTNANPSTARSIQLAPFDGRLDFAGASGGIFEQMVAVDLSNTSTIVDPALLASFSGSGTVSLMLSAQATVSGSGGGNLALNYTTQASASVTVRYLYQSATNPAIDLEKLTNGEDADLPTGPLIEAGEPVVWTYLIHNTGDTTLVNIQLVDDQEGVITCPKDTLAVNEQMICTAQGIAVLGQYANIATVTGETSDAPQQTVTDTDPSHYYGVPLATLCPVDFNGVLELPKVLYLGEGGGPYTLPAGFETFVIKRLAPFRFEVDPGVASNGQQVYTPLNAKERVYACAGACQFPQALRTLFPIGRIGSGITIGAVVIDDDLDDRRNAWVANGDTANPYQVIDIQTMVEYLVLDIPFEADWSFNAVDSIGMLNVCLAPTTSVRSASIWGEGVAAPQAEELNEMFFSHRVLLPITVN
jgi:hypothetical protein